MINLMMVRNVSLFMFSCVFHVFMRLCQHLPSVFSAEGVAHVQPSLEGLSAWLENHLVEVAVLLDEVHVLHERLVVGDEDVGGLAQCVLAVDGSAHLKVEQLASVAAVDSDGSEVGSEGFEHFLAEHHQSDDDDDVWRCVVDATLDGCSRLDEFAEGEVGREEHLLHSLLFLLCVFHTI